MTNSTSLKVEWPGSE